MSKFFDHLLTEIPKTETTLRFRDALENTVDAIFSVNSSIEKSSFNDLSKRDEHLEAHFREKGKQTLRLLTNKDLDLLWDFQNYRLSYVNSDVYLEKLYREILTEYNELFVFIEEEVGSNTRHLIVYLEGVISGLVKDHFAEDLFRRILDSGLNREVGFLLERDGSFDLNALEKLMVCFSEYKTSVVGDGNYEIVFSGGAVGEKLMI